MKDIRLVTLDCDSFKNELVKAVSDAFKEFEKDKIPQSRTEYLTRKDVADLLKISDTTVWRWAKNGRLKKYGLGSRIYYKRAEVEEALILLNP